MSLYFKKNWAGKWIYRTHGYINQATTQYVRYVQKERIRPAALRMTFWMRCPIEEHINA